jgi:hypothetical protein
MGGHDEPLFGMRKTKYIIAEAKRGPFPDNKKGRPQKAPGKNLFLGLTGNKKGLRKLGPEASRQEERFKEKR